MTSRPSKQPVRMIAASLALVSMLAACGSDGQQGEDGILVIATTSILADIASNVVGENGIAESLIPIGGDSHDFAPSSQQLARLGRADLVVANGLNLEESMVDVLDSLRADGVEVIELAPLVDPIPFVESENNEDDGGDEDNGEVEGDEHGAADPHFWNDPIRVGEAALALAGSLEESNPGGGWLARAEAYADEMSAVDTTIRALVENVPEKSRRLVTNHQAFGYFANRYGFELIGVVIPGGSTLAEPSSAELAELVEVMESEGVQVIFAETSQPTTLADAVAAELGADIQVVELFTESLGPPGSDAETLSAMLVSNAEKIASALG
ncbi:MAG TPA: metal ABC transporter substrate-binding protein [Acidimicrobiia bacterium]|nr:metal ABC transporter substrate-binding protein [Acidimicrobiia bacterium]